MDAQIEALGEVTSEEAAQTLANLQASQAALLEQHQQRIAELQGQIDVLTTEQTLIAGQLAEADGENDQAVIDTEPAQDGQTQTAEEQQSRAEDVTQQDQWDRASSDGIQQEEPVVVA